MVFIAYLRVRWRLDHYRCIGVGGALCLGLLERSLALLLALLVFGPSIRRLHSLMISIIAAKECRAYIAAIL